MTWVTQNVDSEPNIPPAPTDLPPVVIADDHLPLISIVTPSFNQGQFIRATIESVLQQDYPNIEYWVIDGGSSDGTLQVLHEYRGDPRLHWISEADRGQADAINKGLARCRGAIFSWLNSDDVLAQGALRRVGSAWLASNRPVIIYGQGRFIDEVGQDLGEVPAQSPSITPAKLLRPGKYYLAQPATFVPTSDIRSIGGVNPAFHYGMDLDLWIKLSQKLPVQYVPFTLAYCRLHPAAKTVALAPRFISDAAQILGAAAQRGLLSAAEARSRTSLFAGRLYLMPGEMKISAGMRSLLDAVIAEPAAAPEAIMIALKAAIRMFLGEKRWAKARLMQLSLRSWSSVSSSPFVARASKKS